MNGSRVKSTYIGQLPYGADLYDGLTRIVRKENIRLGRIQGIGATTYAKVAYYDQNTKVYNPLEFPGGMEILSLSGNVSIRDGKPFVHAHLVLGDPQGKVFGGHLLPGTILFACELFIEELEGSELAREHDRGRGFHPGRQGIFLPEQYSP